MVKELRERTGAGMMDCKKALVESDGDMEKAIDCLREKGLAAAAKKAGRIAAEGVVAITSPRTSTAWASSSRSTARPTSWPRPTTSRTSCHDVAKHIAAADPADVDDAARPAVLWTDASKTVDRPGKRGDRCHRREDFHPPLCPLCRPARHGGYLHPHGRQGRRAG